MTKQILSGGEGSIDQTKCRVLLVDDHPLILQGLCLLLDAEPRMVVCGKAMSAEQAMSAMAVLQPDLVLLDLSLPDKHGLEVIKDMRCQFPHAKILVLSMHEESLYAERSLRAGARGYVMKGSAAQLLVQAIHKIMDGGIYLSRQMADCMLELIGGKRPSSSHSALERLTDREMEVFSHIGAGKSSREIANLLKVSIRTVDAHRAHLKEKLHLRDGVALLRTAVSWVQGRAVEK